MSTHRPLDKIRHDLEQVMRRKISPDRTLHLALLISEALQQIQRHPILVGGAAVEYYTEGEYVTADIDMVTDGGEDLRDVMVRLGFERHGKDFVNNHYQLYVEFPGSQLGPEERWMALDVGGQQLRIISIEDLIVDRLNAYKFWQSSIDGVNALLLLEQPDIDENRLLDRCRQDHVADALEVVKEIKEQAIRKKMNPKKVSDLLEAEKKKLKKQTISS